MGVKEDTREIGWRYWRKRRGGSRLGCLGNELVKNDEMKYYNIYTEYFNTVSNFDLFMYS